MTTRKPKPSEIFEGPNSSLRRTFEEATRDTKQEDWEMARMQIVGLIHALADSEKARGYEESKGAIRRDGGSLMAQEIAAKRILEIVFELLSSQSVLKGERRRVIAQIREEVRGEVRKNGFIVGKREGDAFKEYSWDDVLRILGDNK